MKNLGLITITLFIATAVVGSQNSNASSEIQYTNVIQCEGNNKVKKRDLCKKCITLHGTWVVKDTGSEDCTPSIEDLETKQKKRNDQKKARKMHNKHEKKHSEN